MDGMVITDSKNGRVDDDIVGLNNVVVCSMFRMALEKIKKGYEAGEYGGETHYEIIRLLAIISSGKGCFNTAYHLLLLTLYDDIPFPIHRVIWEMADDEISDIDRLSRKSEIPF